MSNANPSAKPLDPGYYESPELRHMGFQRVGEDVRIARNCTLIGLANVAIGSHVRIDGGTVIAAHAGSLELGDYIHIGAGCYLACAGGITLADFCGLSQGVRIYSASDDYSGESLTNPTVPREFLNVTVAPVRLGRHVIVGSGSVILPGADIGEGSSLGALSLATKPLAAWGVYFGAPARRIKARSKKLLELEKRLRAQP